MSSPKPVQCFWRSGHSAHYPPQSTAIIEIHVVRWSWSHHHLWVAHITSVLQYCFVVLSHLFFHALSFFTLFLISCRAFLLPSYPCSSNAFNPFHARFSFRLGFCSSRFLPNSHRHGRWQRSESQDGSRKELGEAEGRQRYQLSSSRSLSVFISLSLSL